MFDQLGSAQVEAQSYLHSDVLDGADGFIESVFGDGKVADTFTFLRTAFEADLSAVQQWVKNALRFGAGMGMGFGVRPHPAKPHCHSSFMVFRGIMNKCHRRSRS